ncbi:MAG: aminomethyltransferase family protein, partial [Caldilineaceae bacterium]|nr:aminomethyltransferase family protein [Caldilineaceae bacterium]
EYGRLRVIGPNAAGALRAAGFAVADLADSAWAEVAADGAAQVIVLKQQAYEIPGFELIAPTAALSALAEQLPRTGIVPVDDATYEVRRIELGRPAAGQELTDAYNPLEAGIGWTCADNKGCYTGQEIIARQTTYDKVTKALVGLRSAAPLTVAAELQADDRIVGVVTSSAVSPQLTAPIALAVVRRPYHEAGTELQVGDQTVTVATLPLVAE